MIIGVGSAGHYGISYTDSGTGVESIVSLELLVLQIYLSSTYWDAPVGQRPWLPGLLAATVDTCSRSRPPVIRVDGVCAPSAHSGELWCFLWWFERQ